MPHWKKYYWVLLCLLGQPFFSVAQEVDSLPSVSQGLPEEVDLELTFNAPRTYVPRTALMWSIVPGGGQIYNRRWWKVPLVFSAFSGVFAVLDFNQSNYINIPSI